MQRVETDEKLPEQESAAAPGVRSTSCAPTCGAPTCRRPEARPDLEPGEARPVLDLVVALDFSEPSRRALEWARRLAELRPARIVAVHAVEPSLLADSDEIARMLEAKGRGRLHEECAEIRRSGIEVVEECRTGRPWSVVREVARALPDPLVVMGARGLGAVRRALLGSVADRVLRLVDGPVLVVHARNPARGRLRAIVATDFSADADAAIALLARIAAGATPELRVELVHVLPPPEVIASPDVPLLALPDLAPVEEAARARLVEAAQPLVDAGLEVQRLVLRGDPARTIASHAADVRADLVVLGRHGAGAFERLLLGSTAEQVLHLARCAVLTSRAPSEAARARRARRAAIVT